MLRYRRTTGYCAARPDPETGWPAAAEEIGGSVISETAGPIRAVKMSDQIAGRLRDEIIAGEFAGGEALRLVALAERLGVSTTPVREALATLERQGLVVGQAHRGFRVADVSPKDIGDAYALSAFMSRRLAERAAERLTPAELDELEALDVEMRAATAANDVVRAGDLNHEIHRRIGRAGGSPLLLRFLREMSPFVTRRVSPDIPGWSKQRSTGHKEIIAALRRGDAKTAGELMEEHILRSGEAAVAFAEGKAESNGSARKSTSPPRQPGRRRGGRVAG